jgi:hypothetical protein
MFTDPFIEGLSPIYDYVAGIWVIEKLFDHENKNC